MKTLIVAVITSAFALAASAQGTTPPVAAAAPMTTAPSATAPAANADSAPKSVTPKKATKHHAKKHHKAAKTAA